MFFGEYLVQQKIISEKDLAFVLDTLGQNNKVPLGQLAVQNGWLSRKELFKILSGQRKDKDVKKNFGTLAIELGFMNQTQIDNLLKMQAQSHQMLGEYLLSKELINRKKLIQSLRAYRLFLNNL